MKDNPRDSYKARRRSFSMWNKLQDIPQSNLAVLGAGYHSVIDESDTLDGSSVGINDELLVGLGGQRDGQTPTGEADSEIRAVC